MSDSLLHVITLTVRIFSDFILLISVKTYKIHNVFADFILLISVKTYKFTMVLHINCYMFE